MTDIRVTSHALEVMRAPVQTGVRTTAVALEVIRLDSGVPLPPANAQPVVVVCCG